MKRHRTSKLLKNKQAANRGGRLAAAILLNRHIDLLFFIAVSKLRYGWRQSIQPSKDQAVHGAERLPLGRMPSQYVNLMPEDQDLGCQRSR
jgi:hypothetical protein